MIIYNNNYENSYYCNNLLNDNIKQFKVNIIRINISKY